MSFRIREDEYDHLKGTCIANGARCLSDFARDVLRNHLRTAANGSGEDGETVEARLNRLDTHLELLDREMRRLLDMVTK